MTQKKEQLARIATIAQLLLQGFTPDELIGMDWQGHTGAFTRAEVQAAKALMKLLSQFK